MHRTALSWELGEVESTWYSGFMVRAHKHGLGTRHRLHMTLSDPEDSGKPGTTRADTGTPPHSASRARPRTRPAPPVTAVTAPLETRGAELPTGLRVAGVTAHITKGTDSSDVPAQPHAAAQRSECRAEPGEDAQHTGATQETAAAPAPAAAPRPRPKSHHLPASQESRVSSLGSCSQGTWSLSHLRRHNQIWREWKVKFHAPFSQ
jgi:hypothetical protein